MLWWHHQDGGCASCNCWHRVPDLPAMMRSVCCNWFVVMRRGCCREPNVNSSGSLGRWDGTAASMFLYGATGHRGEPGMPGRGIRCGFPQVWEVFVHFSISTNPGWWKSTSPRQVCRCGSNCAALMGARLDWRRRPKNRTVRHTWRLSQVRQCCRRWHKAAASCWQWEGGTGEACAKFFIQPT